MDWGLSAADLQRLIGSGQDIAWWQMTVRGVVVFAYGLVLIRLFGRSAFGKHSALDIVLSIVIGSNLSRTITGNAAFGATLAATAALVLCYWLLGHMAARWRFFSRAVKGGPIPLIRGGALDRRQMRRAGVSEGDVAEAARQSGIASLDAVEEAILERSGSISTIRAPKG